MIRFKPLFFLLLLFIFGCSERPEIEFRDSLEEVEAAMRKIIPLVDTLYFLTLDAEMTDRFWGFDVDENREIFSNGVSIGHMDSGGFDRLPGFQLLPANAREEFVQAFAFLFENNIRGVQNSVEVEFGYDSGGKMDPKEYFCVVFLNDGKYGEKGEDEMDRKGNFILECRPLHRILY